MDKGCVLARVVYVGEGVVFVRREDGVVVLCEGVGGVVGGPGGGGDLDVDTVDGVGEVVVDEDVSDLGCSAG